MRKNQWARNLGKYIFICISACVNKSEERGLFYFIVSFLFCHCAQNKMYTKDGTNYVYILGALFQINARLKGFDIFQPSSCCGIRKFFVGDAEKFWPHFVVRESKTNLTKAFVSVIRCT